MRTLMAVLACWAILHGAPALAQEFRGSVLGRVTDASGAVIPGASVRVVNEATNVAVETKTNEEGNYNVPYLIPSRYTVSAAAQGFQGITQPGVVVQINDRIQINLTLQVGATTESVVVTAESPMLQTATADLGQVADSSLLQPMMLTTSVLNLATMAPGVLGSSTLGFGGTMGNSQNDIAVNGGSGTDSGNDVTIDGSPALAPRASGLAVGVPMSEAVQEFKVVTTMFDASLGRTNGGALSITTKSGTNDFHGTGFYYTQNAALNANSWTKNRTGLPRSDVDQYAIGGTFGGPVRLPKYDGRNKTFFFFAYEKDRNANRAAALAFVPTADMRKGDFSQVRSSAGAPLAIYDPLSTTVDASGKFKARALFPNATIPSQRLNATGMAVMNTLPLPNMNVAPQIKTQNWASDMTFPQITKNWSVRVDQAVGDKHRLFGRLAMPRYIQGPDPAYFPGAYSVPPNGTSNLNTDDRRHSVATLDDTVLFSPSLVGSFRVGYTRIYTLNSQEGDKMNPADLNLPAAITSRQLSPAWPIFDIGGDGAPFIGGRRRQSVNDIWSLMTNFNRPTGSHNLRFGVDYRATRWNENNPGTQANGQFTFNNTLTRSDPTKSSTGNTSGSAMAGLLLGMPATSSNRGIGFVSPLSLQVHYGGFWFQDDWKATNRLTVNLGVRYEMETPPTERFDRLLYAFDPRLDLGLTVPGVGPLHGGVLFVNDGGTGRRQGLVDKNNFGPRVGLAYTTGNNVVIRGGYGIFYSSAVNNIGTPTTDGAFGAMTQYVGSTGGDTLPIPGVNINNPFPNGYMEPTGKALGTRTDLGATVSYQNPNRVLPYVQQWQFSVQKQFRSQTLAEVAYVGMHTLKLTEDLSLNDIPDSLLSNTNNVTNPFLGILPAASTLGQGSSIKETQLFKAFPQFNTVTAQSNNTGRVLHHSLQARLQKRFSKGLQLVANYTHAKSMQYRQYSAVNHRDWRTISELDYPNLFNLFLTYDLPVGRGRSFGSNWGRALDTVAGGWSLVFITHYQSGDPLTIEDTNGTPIPIGDPTTSGSYRNRLGDRIDPATKLPVNAYFNRDVWIRIDNFKVSPETPLWSWLRGPSQWTQSATLSKTVPITERVQTELRLQVQSPFNHTVFDNPGTNLASPATFGVITESRSSSTRSMTFGAKLRF